MINFYGENAAEYLAEQVIKGRTPMTKAKRLTVAYRPYQVVGAISPWNFPVILGLEDALAAMTAGSAAVLKPSEFTPLAVNRIVDAWKREIGGPDVFDVVNGVGETGGALIDAVDYIQFTGSERTGKVVMRRAADTLTPVSLELGGKDPAIVLADADIERAVNGTTWGGLANTGQICMSLERVYVEEPIYDEFVDRLAAKVREIRQGSDGVKHGFDVGAMTSPNQVAIVSDHVEDARAAGARILTGGRSRERRRRLLQADGDRRRRPLDEGDARGDLRPRDPGDEGARRRGGDPARQRHDLRPLGLGVLGRRQAGRGGR